MNFCAPCGGGSWRDLGRADRKDLYLKHLPLGAECRMVGCVAGVEGG